MSPTTIRRTVLASALTAVAVLRLPGLDGRLMITGQWVRLFIPLLRLFSRANWPAL